MSEKIKSLCLAGAFNRGICYLGALKKLEEENMLDIKKLIGVSIGSLIGVGMVVGFTPTEMYKLIVEKDTKEFMDVSILNGDRAVLRGEIYRKWVHNIVQSKILSNKWIPDLTAPFTLKDLYDKTGVDLTIVTTCIYSNNDRFKEGVIYFNHLDHGDIPVTFAIIASMTFPFIFPPMEYEGSYFIDGGVVNNFPIEKIDKDGLGICPVYDQLNGLECTRNPISYCNKIFELMSNHISLLKNITYDNILIIKCNKFNSIEFNMTIDDKITLYKLGYHAAEDYIKK